MNESQANDDTRSIVIERQLPYPPEKVWRALTQSELIADWLMENDFRALEGQRFSFRTDPMPHWNGVTDCEVLAVEPHRRLSYSWCASGAEAANGLKTVVTWTLTPTPDGVLLRMEQSGFSPRDKRNYQGAKFGWQRFLDGLDRVLAALA